MEPSNGRRGFRGRGNGFWRWAYKKRGNRGYQRGRGGSTGSSGPEEDGSNIYPQRQNVNFSSGARGRGRGNNNNYSPNNNYCGNSNYNQLSHKSEIEVLAPPRKKVRTSNIDTVKESVLKQWRALLPGYDLYYGDGDGPPQLPETEKKILGVELYLKKTRFVENVSGCERIRDDDEVGEENVYFSLSVETVVCDEEFSRLWPDFDKGLVNEPEQTLTLWSAAAHKVMCDSAQSDEGSPQGNDQKPLISKIRMGFFKSGPVTPLISLKSDHIGKFVTIRGAVVSAGNIRPYLAKLTFRCRFCDGTFVVRQLEGKYTPPTCCKATDECRNTYSFEPLETAPTTVLTDSRRIRVQDVLNCDIERGTIPKTIDCVLFGTWADQCDTGDLITLSGINKMAVSGADSLRHNYIEVSAIQQQKDSERTMGGNLLSFTQKDYFAVRMIHDEPNLFRLLISSLCPGIFGHELVKAGLLLSLFGGTVQNEGVISRRSDINMLMIGDPGIGKSQMLKVVTEVAPRAVYVCGTGSTGGGLTVALVKDGDDYSLEAGALVMADKGVCCIDEFDKMSSQHHALLEAMEQQSVSVAKSGIYRTLPARTTVIAAANPVGGHYNQCKTIAENIKINPAVLSRFDLIFILLDRPDEEFDRRLVDHKVALRMGHGGITRTTGCNSTASGNTGEQLKLIDRIKPKMGEVMDIIPRPLLRKYIAYAKQYVNPRLTKEAREMLKRYYKNLREQRRSPDSTPVTARQLESLFRLAQARAKAELREEVTEQDASDVLEIFEFSLSSAFDNEVLAISALSDSILMLNSSLTGRSAKPKSIQSQAKHLVVTLQQQAVKSSKDLFSAEEIKNIAAAIGYKEKATTLLDILNEQGCLLKKGAGLYQLIS